MIKTYEANILDSDLHKDRFDVVMTAAMLEYLPKNAFVQVLKKLKDSLGQDGKIIIFISKKSLLNLLLITLWWKADLYTKDELTRLLKEAGFDHIVFRRFPP